MASYRPNITYGCEICGAEELSEEQFREHTHSKHIDGRGVCPFCGLTAVSASELTVHVNQAHLDFLTPDAEVNMTFIDDTSPSEINEELRNHRHQSNIPSFPSHSNSHSNSFSSNSQKGSVNNINVNGKVNGGGDVSPKKFGHGHGSPLRSSLDLKLKNSMAKLQCPLCSFTSISPEEIQEHVNRRHFDLTSPSISKTKQEIFSCPLCVKNFSLASDLELHVNIEHRDILSPASPPTKSCPVCGISLDGKDNSIAIRHVESHFPGNSPSNSDQAALREREQKEFEMLRAQYGMDNQGNFREQCVTNMQRAVYAGEMSVSDYYERTLDLRAAESSGIDDCSSVTRSIVPRVRAMSSNAQNVVRTLLCTCIDHFASSYGDRGWGCGYRNTQMMISSLLTHTGFNERLYKLWKTEKPPRSAIPSISRLQSLVEQAWSQGFDVQGSEQLGCRLFNTRKWIGATEVVTLLSFLRIKCQLVDFHRPTGPGGSHPELFNWVLKYFENSIGGEFTPPLYLQHQGHSRTIMGIEIHRDGSVVMLVLDPSHSPQQMAQFGDTSTANASLRLLRKSEAAMKAKQYQIVAVVGTIDSEQEYQENKVNLIAETRPAPFVLKPLAGLYNPYRFGCSLLCNHPTDEEAKELLRRAKDTWANESKRTVLFDNEIAAIRDSLEQLQIYSKQNEYDHTSVVEVVPEELFRRYTDTDSRPLTPAPTLSSAATKASGSRRCVTPDPICISTVREKTLIVLDLRRSHSQEMICGGTSFLDPPLILIQQVPTRRGSLDDIANSHKKSSYTLHMPATARMTKSHKDSTSKIEVQSEVEDVEKKTAQNDDIGEVYVKRRGKKRHKQRNGSTALPVQASTDPETQVGTVGPDSYNPSVRHSLVPGSVEDINLQEVTGKNLNDSIKTSSFQNVQSFLDIDILKLLRRELTDEIYDNEFDWKRRIALREALKTISDDDNTTCEELMVLQKELNLPPPNTDLWISIPRVFSRANARFELPPYSGMLQTMTPMEYIKDNVHVTNRRKIMYNSIFNKFKRFENGTYRRIAGKDMLISLHVLMGQNLSKKPLESFKELVGWEEEELYDFQTFSCICATCERLLASNYTKNLPDKKEDPCHELETADFESLNKKLLGQNADERLIKILFGIKNF